MTTIKKTTKKKRKPRTKKINSLRDAIYGSPVYMGQTEYFKNDQGTYTKTCVAFAVDQSLSLEDLKQRKIELQNELEALEKLLSTIE